MREGFTQEFFIEGGRSRTGKTLAPRLGMLGWDVDAFLECSRRDLFFVPIGDHLRAPGRRELAWWMSSEAGLPRRRRACSALVRARKYLQKPLRQRARELRRAHLPGGLAGRAPRALPSERCSGEGRRCCRGRSDVEGSRKKREKKQFIEELGHRIVERINWAVVANATSVAAGGAAGRARTGVCGASELVERMQQIVGAAAAPGRALTAALLADGSG